MLGGYGSCGRPLCCTTWLQTFEPISIKMAKQQNLSLNPVEAVGDVRPAEVLPALRAAERQGRQARRLRRRRRLRIVQQPDRAGRRLRNVRHRAAAAGSLQVTTRPRIGITVGDPAGIGPEIARKAARGPGGLGVLRAGPLRPVDATRTRARSSRGRVSAAGGPRRLRRDRRAPWPMRTAGRDRRDRDGADQQGSVCRGRVCRGAATPTCSRTSPARRAWR